MTTVPLDLLADPVKDLGLPEPCVKCGFRYVLTGYPSACPRCKHERGKPYTAPTPTLQELLTGKQTEIRLTARHKGLGIK